MIGDGPVVDAFTDRVSLELGHGVWLSFPAEGDLSVLVDGTEVLRLSAEDRALLVEGLRAYLSGARRILSQ